MSVINGQCFGCQDKKFSFNVSFSLVYVWHVTHPQWLTEHKLSTNWMNLVCSPLKCSKTKYSWLYINDQWDKYVVSTYKCVQCDALFLCVWLNFGGHFACQLMECILLILYFLCKIMHWIRLLTMLQLSLSYRKGFCAKFVVM